jgi:hypothetical protein
MFNRVIDSAKSLGGNATSYLMGEGSRPLLQNITDYGTAAALAAAGQQGMNWMTGGADPNPLLSGVLAAPALTFAGRGIRGSINPASTQRDAWNAARQMTNPYEQAALYGSATAGIGGALTSGYNTVAGGNDIDNNLIAGGLGSLAPITLALLNRYGKSR